VIEQGQGVGHRRLGQRRAHLAAHRGQRGQALAVDGQGLVAVLGVEAQGAFHLAAGQARAQRLAEGGLEVAQRLGQAEVGLEVALVHRAQLQLQAAPGGLAYLAGEGGHAVNPAAGIGHRRAPLAVRPAGDSGPGKGLRAV